ncbi:MAG: PH domain-containing protein, partial [Actinomycetia bacterium]|nr:PH domain-containing protein [Actinomycetes bacterium]
LRAEVFNRRRAASATGLASAPAAAGPLVGQAALAGSASAVQRFDPQTGQPLPPPGVLATGGPTTVVVPRFDPQTGQPLPPPVSTADQVVAGLGDLSSGLRGIFAENYDENVPIEFEYTLRARELLLAAISSDTNISSILIMAVVLLQTAAMFIPMLISDDALSNAAIISNGNLIPLLVIGTLGFIVFIFALTVLGMAVNLGGFQGRRRGGRIEVEHGLLQRVYRGVGIPKVQTVVVKQGFIRRLIGYAELTIQTIDTAGASNNPQGNNVQSQVTRGLVLHPFIKLEQVDSLLSGLLPEFNGRPQPVDYQPLPRVALRRAINRRVLLPAPIVLIPLVGIPWLIFGLSWPQFSLSSASLVQSWLFGGLVAWSALWLLIWIIRVFGAVFWYRNARYAWNRDYLVLHQGAWSLTDTYIPRRKIQWGEYLQTPFQRWSEVATVQATTAAGLGHTSTALKDLPLLAAESYLDWLRPHGLEQSSRG